jgi:hypothetical protein
VRSSSSGQQVGLKTKLQEALFHLSRTVRDRGPFAASDFSDLEADLAEYRVVAREYGSFELLGATAFEIGYGPRPYRLLYLAASGVDVSGVDLDVATLGFRPTDLVDAWTRNGAERALKTGVRYITSDVFENRRLRAHLTDVSGDDFTWPRDRMTTGSAADPTLWPTEPVDFIYSEDVFEHIPAQDLPVICALIAEHLSDRGVAMIRPNVFTGIKGGHHIDFYDLDPDRPRTCPPWDHLREHRHPAATYLNKLSRADYRVLFGEHFTILDESVRDPDLGRALMTPEIREELAAYPDDELFSNTVRFVLRPR